MSDNPESKKNNDQLEAVKRQAGEIVDDLKARKLLLPAIVLAVAIVAAMVVLPQKSSDVPPPSTADVPRGPQGPTAADKVASVSVVDLGETPSGEPLSSAVNPFKQGGSYSCRTIQERSPRTLVCDVAGLDVRVQCTGDQEDQPPCAPEEGSSGGGGGSSGETGSSGKTGSGGSGGNNSGGSGGNNVNIYVYKATVVFDGKTYKNIEQGEILPSKKNPVVQFDGVNDAATRALFVVQEGTTVAGVPTDKSGLNFVLQKGQTATITDSSGEVHKLKLTSITKAKI